MSRTALVVQVENASRERALVEAMRQNKVSEARGWEHRCAYLPEEDPLFNTWLGKCGEIALAHIRNEPWDAVTDQPLTGARDQGPFEVRTRRFTHYELFIRERDPRGVPWVLVHGQDYEQGLFEVRGWVWGFEIESLGRDEDFGNRGASIKVIAHKHLHSPVGLIDWPREVLSINDYGAWRRRVNDGETP